MNVICIATYNVFPSLLALYMTNSIGPNTDPCGTPQIISRNSDTTLAPSHKNNLPLILNLLHRRIMEIIKDTFARSWNTLMLLIESTSKILQHQEESFSIRSLFSKYALRPIVIVSLPLRNPDCNVTCFNVLEQPLL